jgi:uncharacterized membrane protein
MPAFRFERRLRDNLWVLPLLCVLAGVALVLITLAIDRATGYRLVPQSITGSPSDARTALSTFASATASLTGLVLTVTLVAVQLAMGQFSPRIVGALLTDRFSQASIGLFGATFVVTVLTLREVRGSDSGTVPGLSMLFAYLLMLTSVVVLILFVHHAGQGLRVSGLVDLVGDRTRLLIHRTLPAPEPVGGCAENDVVRARRPGTLLGLEREALVAAARRANCVLELLATVGDFVPQGAPLFRIHPDPSPAPARDGRAAEWLDHDALDRLVVVGSEREHAEDLAYGVRKLVDIAERSVAQPFDDPTTAVQALHRLHELMRDVAVRPLPSGEHRDEHGTVRLVERTLTWSGYVRLAFDEVRLAGAGVPQVSRRVCAALHDLKSVAPPDRQEPLDRQLRLLAAAVERAYDDDEDVLAALTPDLQGIGSGADLTTPPLGSSSAAADAVPHHNGLAAPRRTSPYS